MEEFKDEKIRMHELKQRAKAYYATGGDGDGVLMKMQEILNSMFYDKPEDVFGHLVRASVIGVFKVGRLPCPLSVDTFIACKCK